MQSKNNKFILGVALLLIGASLMLNNLNIFPEWHWVQIVFSWKMLLVLLGGTIIITASNKIPGIVLVLIGGMFILSDLNVLPDISFWRILLPIILIGIGLSIILSKPINFEGFDSLRKTSSLDMLDEVAILGGSKKIISSKGFKGGKVTAILGGGEIDLTRSQLSEGVNVLEVVAILGGSSILVPDDWNIKIDVVSILGGFSDSRKQSGIIVRDESKVLIIKGFVLLGGGEIK